MRALPTALIRPDAERRRTESGQISAITHAHPRCVNSSLGGWSHGLVTSVAWRPRSATMIP